LFINIQSISDSLPAKVSATILTDGELQNIQREMGDGKSYTTQTLSLLHTYTTPGTYLIRAIGTDKKGNKAEASAKIYI
jgi:PKD repeat protein